MPWRGPQYPGELATLGYLVAEWIQAYCVIPDRELRGQPFVLTTEQLWFLLHHYALTADGRWRYPRGSQLIRPQKWGKGPLAAAIVCAEAEGPVRFAGWDAAGEPMGEPWATPLIQITACSEDQTDNTWRAIQPMIELGPLGESFIPDTGLKDSPSGPSSIIGWMARQVLSVWSSEQAVIWMSGVAHGSPIGSPAASQPAKRTGPSASAQTIAAASGPLPHFCGRISCEPRG